MSIVEYSEGAGACGEVHVPANHRALHRLATVRRLQGISRRTVARRLNVEVAEIRRQEEETNDLPLSVLYEWQKALDVPVAELLVESEDALSQPLLQRAQLVRLMKTALAILEHGRQRDHARDGPDTGRSTRRGHAGVARDQRLARRRQAPPAWTSWASPP